MIDIKNHIALVVSLLAFASCATIKVDTDYDRTNDFSNYQTFCWLQGCDFTYDGPAELFDSTRAELLQNAIVNQLNDKGYTQNEDEPDFLIDYHIVVEQNDTLLTSYSFNDEIYPTSWYPFSDHGTHHYLKGSLVIDIVDTKSGAMVWRSDATGYMDLEPGVKITDVEKVVKLALKKFPSK